MPAALPILSVIIIYALLFCMFLYLLPRVVKVASVAWYEGKKIVDEGRS
jgi:hypothetical protein